MVVVVVNDLNTIIDREAVKSTQKDSKPHKKLQGVQQEGEEAIMRYLVLSELSFSMLI